MNEQVVQPNAPDEPGRQNDQPQGTGPMAASVPSDCSADGRRVGSEFPLPDAGCIGPCVIHLSGVPVFETTENCTGDWPCQVVDGINILLERFDNELRSKSNLKPLPFRSPRFAVNIDDEVTGNKAVRVTLYMDVSEDERRAILCP